jgi:acyl-CoA reductase-like NAD-dependent aldehyde dehydrogenase
MIVTSINPRTGERIRDFETSTPEQIDQAVIRATKAQLDWWEGRSREERADALQEMGRTFAKAKEQVVDIAFQEIGVPKRPIAASYDSALRGIDHYISRYEEYRDRPFPLDQDLWVNTEACIRYEPHGVVGHIGVWNFPFWQTMITAIPALLAGNAIVFKPSEMTTGTGLKIAELIHASGVPEDVYVPIVGGAETGKRLVRSQVDALVFTGGMRTGESIIRDSGVKPLVLELSGNDPGIVCGDADIEQAARGVATGTFSRAGQVCIRIKRVYVLESIADAFLERLLAIASRIDVREQVGPLIREEARERVHRVVMDAVSRGAELLAGGRKDDGPGFFYEPTVLLIKDDSLEVIAQETFGPVCSIRLVRSEEEAVELANASPYGLGATIWTADMHRAGSLASRLRAGNIWVNEWGRTLPGGEYFQGCKRSGIAGSQDRLGLFLRKKTVISHQAKEPRPSWFS